MSAGLNVFIYLQFKILCNSSFHYLFDPRIISIRVTLFPKMESFPEVLLCSCLLWFVRCIQRSPGAGADYFLPWRQDLTDYPIHSTVRRCFPSLAQENRQNSWGWVSLVRGHNCLALWPGSCSLFRWFLPGLRCFLTDGRCAFLRWIPEGLCLRSPGFFFCSTLSSPWFWSVISARFGFTRLSASSPPLRESGWLSFCSFPPCWGLEILPRQWAGAFLRPTSCLSGMIVLHALKAFVMKIIG